MGITVQLYNEESTAWNAFVASRRDATNYHRYGWRRVVEKSFGHRTIYLVAKNNRGVICGLLPYVHMKSRLFGTFLVSLPFFNYGGLLCSEDCAATALLDYSRDMLGCTGSSHVELRHREKNEDVGATKQHKVAMILNLKRTEDDQWKALDPKVRNQVRKAEKNGLQAISGHGELLDGFYKVNS